MSGATEARQIPYEELINVKIVKSVQTDELWQVLFVTRDRASFGNLETGERKIRRIPIDTREFMVTELR